MYAKFSSIMDGHGNRIHNAALKPHHHIRLDQEFKLDCAMWKEFLTSPSVSLCRPFIDLSEQLHVDVLQFYTDVAKGTKLGLGAVFGQSWLFAQWEANYIEECDPSIEYLELLGICMGVFAWTDRIKNRRIILFCNNQSVVSMVNNTTSKCKNCMVLVRMLTLRCLKYNTRVFCHWIMGSKNIRADLLSRQKLSRFFEVVQERKFRIDSYPTVLPHELWPASKIWIR